MKSAERWLDESIANANTVGNRVWVKRIQLDAIKEGMRRAAVTAEDTTFAAGKHTDWEDAYDKGCRDCQQAILNAADNLTEI